MCISFHAINVTTFNTHSPIQHPLPLSLSTPTPLFNTLFPILHPLPPSAPTPTPPFNSHKFHVLQPPVTASFRFFPRTVILATRHFPIKNCLFILPIWFLSPSPFLFTFLDHFFSLLDNFLSFVVQPILHLDVSNLLSFSCFSFCSLSKSFSKRETFFFSSPQKFTFLENFFQMQRYEILITFTYKTNFFFRKTQKKLFFPSPTPSFVHCPPCFLMVESLVAFDYPESLILMFMNDRSF